MSGTAPGGSRSGSTASAPGESGSGAERDLSRALFCRNRGSFDGAGDDGDEFLPDIVNAAVSCHA